MTKGVVYWLYDDTCIDPMQHGYVGVTINLRNRLKWHRARRRPFEYCILFEGSEQECLALEAKMRPNPLIGWNKIEGGVSGVPGPKSAEHRQKIREAALRRYADPREREKMSEVQKGRNITWGAKISAAKVGKLNPAIVNSNQRRKGMSLQPRTPEHSARISAAKKGKKIKPHTLEHRAKMLGNQNARRYT